MDKDLYNSFDDLVEAIREHNKAFDGPVTIISSDKPMNLVFGFYCLETNSKFNIRLRTVGSNRSSEKGELIARTMLSIEGKEKLAQILSEIK